MNLSTVKIQYDTEKLSAIRHYMKDESKLQVSMEARLQELYEKYVPDNIRNVKTSKTGGMAIWDIKNSGKQ